MGSSLSTKLKVGFTTLFAITILIVGVLWVKQYNPMKKRETMSVVFFNARGITAGDPVTISGIKVGEISSVALSEDNKALIAFTIDTGVNLFSDCTFVIEDVGLMGDKMLTINPGTTLPALDHTKLQNGTEGKNLNDLIAGADEIIKRFNRIGDKIEKDVDLAALTTSFESTFSKIQETIEIFRVIAEENREPLKNSVAGLEKSSDDLRTFISRSTPKIDEALTSFQNTSDKLSLALDNLDGLSTVVDTLSIYMENGEGTLGKLIKSDDLYSELRRTNANLDAFISDFKKNPGKYTKDMNFKIRLF